MQKSIDWNLIKARLEKNRAILEKGAAPDSAAIEKIYRQRAAELASQERAAGPSAEGLQALTFTLGKERYGIYLSDLSEVRPLDMFTPVPGARPELLGVINLRGEIRPVIHLDRLLDLSAGAMSEGGNSVLFFRNQRVGLWVEQVERLRQVLPEEIVNSNAADVSDRYIRGITTDALILLDVQALFQHPIFSGEI